MNAPSICLRRSTVALLASIVAGPCVASGATLEVGPGKAYATLASLPALSPGDRVEISPGTYNEVRRWLDGGDAGSPITVIGVGASRPVIDGTGQNMDGSMPNPRAIFQIEAANLVFENLAFINARNVSNNGAGIRITGAAAVGVTIRNCKITYCDMGMMSNGCDDVLIESCEIAYNGTSLYSGYSHNLYLGGGRTTLTYCYIHDSLFGQNLKSRGHYTEILYCCIADSQDGEVGLVDEAETALANANAVMIGCVVVSKDRSSDWNSNRFVQFGQDMGGAHNGTMYVVNNTFIAGTGSIRFFDANATGSFVVAHNNILRGSTNVSTGNGPVTGTNNWIETGASVPANFLNSIEGSDPGFVSEAGGDYHLTAASPCLNAGTESPTYRDDVNASYSAVPTSEYVNHVSSTARLSDGSLDCGAYERLVLVAPQIVTPPADATVDEGQTATFTVSATGTAPLSYQWALSTDGGTTWADIGTDAASYTTPVTSLADDGNQYRVTVSNDDPTSATSSAATLTVDPPDQLTLVQISSPTDAATLAGNVPVSVQARDPDGGALDGEGIEQVLIELVRSGVILATVMDTEAPYAWSLDSDAFADGTYTIRATATSDLAAGATSAVDSISVAFDNSRAADRDTDGEGLPDWWEDLHGLDPGLTDSDSDTLLDADEDPDADGFSNLQEYENGTDPNVFNAPPPEGDGAGGVSCDPAGGQRPDVAVLVLMAAVAAFARRAVVPR